jgi:uncharacterized protein YhfF
MSIEKYWNQFLKENDLDESTTYIDVFHFDLTERVANALLHLVLIGQKKATCSSLLAFKDEIVPKPGDYSIITDWDGNPRCIIQTTKIHNLKFKDMTFELCSKEGEDDSLESWKKSHTHFFTEEGKQLGYSFDEDMDVVFEEFEVVYK